MPTHAGLGLRFDLNGVGGGDDEEGYVMDLGCRLDLFQWELPTSNGDDPIHPVPAVHIEAELWKQDEHNFQDLHHGPSRGRKPAKIGRGERILA